MQDVAREFGLPADEVERAIRAWAEKVTDPYEKGPTTLHEGTYPGASKSLAASLEIREKELRQAQNDVADAAFFLGASLYEQGRYRESAEAYRKALGGGTAAPESMARMNWRKRWNARKCQFATRTDTWM